MTVPAASLVVDDAVSDPSSALTFSVSTPVSKLKFRAKSERERAQWLDALAKEAQVVAESMDTAESTESSAPSSARSELFSTPIGRRPSQIQGAVPLDLSAVRRPLLEGVGSPVAASAEESIVADPQAQAQQAPPSSSAKSPRGGGKSPRRRKKKSTNTGGKKRRKRDKVVALYDIVAPPGSGRISVTAGEVLLLVQRTNQTWFKVQSHAGVSGYIPATYVTPHISGISSLEPPPQPPMPAEDFVRAAFTAAPASDAAVLSSLLSPRQQPRGTVDDDDEEEEKTEN